jgi:hypothetical protein
MKIVSVQWRDAWSHDEQCDIDLAVSLCSKPLNVTTVGFLIADTDDCVIVCREFMEEDNKVSGIMHIPKGWLLEPIKIVNNDD